MVCDDNTPAQGQWHAHCDVGLGSCWLSDHMSGGRSPASGLQVNETVEGETTGKGGYCLSRSPFRLNDAWLYGNSTFRWCVHQLMKLELVPPLVIMSGAAMNMRVEVFAEAYVFISLGCMLRTGILLHLCLTVWGSAWRFSKTAPPGNVDM